MDREFTSSIDLVLLQEAINSYLPDWDCKVALVSRNSMFPNGSVEVTVFTDPSISPEGIKSYFANFSIYVNLPKPNVFFNVETYKSVARMFSEVAVAIAITKNYTLQDWSFFRYAETPKEKAKVKELVQKVLEEWREGNLA